MVSEEEQRILRAYNAGHVLAMYEPKILESIIKSNRNNEFVRIMRAAKDHQEFYQNIPRKDFTREYKNGFSNARAIIENDPKLLDQLLSTKKLHKDYLRGLEAGKAEYHLKKIRDRVKNQIKPVSAEYKPDFTRGFNDGYRLSVNHIEIVNFAIDAQKRWSPYIRGLQAGQQQYAKEVEAELTKKDIAAIDVNNPEISDEAYNKIRNKVEGLKENSEGKLDYLEASERRDIAKDAEDTDKPTKPLPGWLKNDRFGGTDAQPDIPKNKDRNIEPDR
ncbi:MAG TPA: hypothetical protein VHA56_09140 [Mucilaginibacter sp.]|nr:hypothetical protein [Mucilaginibacter sp.]